ncbi:MAG: PIN domain-containing protein [Cyanobacteria bacterium J06559_3]
MQGARTSLITVIGVRQQCLPQVEAAAEAWITEAILIEVGNGLSATNRKGASAFIESCYQTTNIRVVAMNTALLREGLALYRARADKAWGLTDCISFVVMKAQSLRDAVTADVHFMQAGYRAPMVNSTR